jgi:hypothetical protein
MIAKTLLSSRLLRITTKVETVSPFHTTFFHNGIECAAKCQLDVDIIDKYSPSLENNGQECQRRAIPHGKNECSFNTYMNVKTDHKISVFVIGRQTNSIKKDLSDMQNLFDAIVASESFMKMCQEQAKKRQSSGSVDDRYARR